MFTAQQILDAYGYRRVLQAALLAAQSKLADLTQYLDSPDAADEVARVGKLYRAVEAELVEVYGDA